MLFLVVTSLVCAFIHFFNSLSMCNSALLFISFIRYQFLKLVPQHFSWICGTMWEMELRM